VTRPWLDWLGPDADWYAELDDPYFDAPSRPEPTEVP
jgi:hypothetical protein